MSAAPVMAAPAAPRRRLSPWLLLSLVVAAGMLAAASLALASGAGTHDTAVVIGLAALGSVVAAALGALLMRLLRGRSLRVQLLAVGLAVTLTTAAGVLMAAQAMFIRSHDVVVLGVVLLVSGAIAIGASLWLGGSFERSVGQVGGMARQLATGGRVSVAGPPMVTGELQRLSEELTEASAALDASRQRAQALDASRRELVAWVSHDLRSPIAAIRAMAEALEDGVVDDPESVARYHRAMRQESERLAALVDDLFELSRIASGSVDAGQAQVPLGELLADVLDGSGPMAAARGVRLVALLDEAPAVLVPASDLRRVLHNLLDNAIRHTPSGGEVVLDSACDGRGVALSVADQCGGIPADELDRVFDVAFRGDAARTRDRAGGGLGLAIARGLVEAHDGSIAVINRVEGCEFTVHLPGGSP
jgi:signal transduction histidine kinase